MYRMYIALFVVALCGSVGYAGYRYVTNTQEQLATLQANNKILEDVVAVTKKTLDVALEDQARFEESNLQLQADLQAAETGLNELRLKLNQHDLTRLTISKPGLIENRINDATKELFNQLRNDTTSK